MQEVQDPALVRAFADLDFAATLRANTLAGMLPDLKAFFFIDAIDALVMIHVAISLESDLQSAVAPALALLSLLAERSA